MLLARADTRNAADAMPKIDLGYGIQVEVDLALRHLHPDRIAMLVTSLRMAGIP